MLKRCHLFSIVFVSFFWSLPLKANEAPAPESLSMVKDIVQTLASDSFKGRPPKSKESKQAQDYLESLLKEHGFFPAGTKKNSYRFRYKGGTSLVAVWHANPEKPQNPTVLLSAHYDHLAENCAPHQLANSSICNGASDNAAGVAAVILAATQLKQSSVGSFAILLSDGEESQLSGSRAFVAKPSLNLAELNLVLNLDIVGLNLFEGMEHHHMMFGLETTAPSLQKLIHQATGNQNQNQLVVHSFSYGLSHGRSDHTSFLTAKKPIASILLTDGSGGSYHSAADEWQRVNFEKVVAVANLSTQIALSASPSSKAGSAVSVSTQPLTSDIASMVFLLEAILAHQAQNGLYGPQLSKLRKHRALLKRYQKQNLEVLNAKAINQLQKAAADLLQISRENFFQRLSKQ